jgi:uncharacterized protein YcgI (DUF1989 family)
MCGREEDRQTKRIFDHVIAPKLAFGLVVKRGQSLRIIEFHLLWR